MKTLPFRYHIAGKGVFFMLLTTVKDEFVFHCQSRNLSPKTTKNYGRQIEYLFNYLAQEYQITHIEDVKPEYIKAFLLKMKPKEPLNNRLYLVSTQCISRHLRLAEVISAQNSHYLSTFLLRFPKKGRLPLCQVVESFRPAIASAYKLAQANIAYSRFSFFLSPRYTVFL